MYFLTLGVIYGNILKPNNLTILLNQDLRYLMHFTIGIIFASTAFLGSYHRLMKYLGIISIVFALISLITFNPSDIIIETRGNTWTLSYYLWWSSAGCFAYWSAYTIITNKEKILGYGVLLSYFILGVIFLKRSVVINTVFIVLISLLFRTKSAGNSFSRLIGIVFIVFTGFFLVIQISSLDFFGNLLDSLFSRFSAMSDISDIDRVQEWKTYRTGASIWELIFGSGAGNYPILHISYGSVSSWRLNAMHIGLANLIFKGGVIYVAFYAYLYLKVFRRILHSRYFPPYLDVCICVALANLLSLFYEGSWTYSTELIGYVTPLIIAATYDFHPNTEDITISSSGI